MTEQKPPYQPDHGTECRSSLALNTSRDGVSTRPWQLIPVSNYPFCEEIPPTVQPKVSLMQLQALSPCPVVT